MKSYLTSPVIAHPRKECVPMAAGLAWGNDGAIYQEKLDGVFHVITLESSIIGQGNSILAGELMRGNGKCGSHFIAWDCIAYEGNSVGAWATTDRLAMMGELCRAAGLPMVETAGNGAALLQRVLARGGEGIVRKLPGATYWDTMTACKRLQTWLCRVVALNHVTGGATIADAATGEARGTCPLRNRAALCRAGSIIKVEGLCLNAGGAIRDPRPCRDTETSWLVKL